MKIHVEIILTILFVAFLILYCGTQPSTWPGGDAPVLPGPTKQGYEEIKKKMLLHGTLFAKMDASGQWWFYRRGKKCRLK